MKKQTTRNILNVTQSGPSASGPGPCQPPRKSAAARPENTMMCMYSAMKNAPKRMPPYSVLYPATSSESASGRSNGIRAVSAMPAMTKITKPTNCGTTYQMWSCLLTMSTSESEPAVIATPSSDSPSETSYEISCATDRIAPRNEYFEPLAQPPSMNAYTASEPNARK